MNLYSKRLPLYSSVQTARHLINKILHRHKHITTISRPVILLFTSESSQPKSPRTCTVHTPVVAALPGRKRCKETRRRRTLHLCREGGCLAHFSGHAAIHLPNPLHLCSPHSSPVLPHGTGNVSTLFPFM